MQKEKKNKKKPEDNTNFWAGHGSYHMEGSLIMLNAVRVVLKENLSNRYRLLRLANYELKTQNSGTVFGFLWNFLNPALQIFVYWFIFSIGLRIPPPKGDYPYIIWMIVGIIPWFYISSALMSSTTSIYSFIGVLKRMRFPVAIVPVKTVLAAIIGHIWAMVVVFGVIFLSGYTASFYSVQVVYYIFCGFAFLVGYALLTSAITVIFKDFQKIMSSVVRLLFYITPIVWGPENLPERFRFIFKLNPLAYVVEGYRESILYGVSFIDHWRQGAYFWIVTAILFFIGCGVHMKLRKQFFDLI